MSFRLKIIFIILLLTTIPLSNEAVAQKTVSTTSPAWAKYKNPYVGDYNNISKPHRTTYEISNWAQQTVAEVISFDPKKFKIHIKEIKKYFVKEGWIKYAKYLNSSDILDLVINKGYSIRSIVNRPPEIINKGSSDKVYHWIVKMPVTISIFKKDKNNNIKTRSTENYTLYMDLKRIKEKESNNHANIAIYDWRVDNKSN